ncbi:MAG TPA: general secretion pathway protein GspB [Thermodesulfobacteriota bacterium]|nr:general secretion pathway protein GspB [Thermodesulfobacteriota bacterium]
MSVILDALKKLDREKSYRGNGTPNIVAEVLKPDLSHPVKRIRLYFLIVALTVLTTLAATYAVMVKFGFLPRPSPSIDVHPPSLNQPIAPAPLESKLRMESSPGSVTPRAESQQVAPAAVSREPIRDVREKENQIHPKIEAPAEGKIPVEAKTPVEIKPPDEPKPSAETKTPATSLDEKKAVMPEKVEAAPGSVKKTVEPTPNVSPTTPPTLKLSAIAWYEDPSIRFAMINGIKATEGSEIEGVKVVEIKPTSVRFLHNGRYFEISMTW